MTNTKQQIRATISEIKQLHSAQKHHESTSAQLDEAYEQLNKLEDQLVKELKDIEKLEKMSIKSVFYNILGSKEEQLEKERQEYLQASLKHKELKKSIEILEYEHGLIGSKVDQIEGLDKELEELKAQRLTEIMTSNSITRQKLVGIHSQMDDASAMAEELRQAQMAGARCLQSIGIVIKHLRDAENWGNWDMMSNKSTYYSQMKHGAIDRAAHAAQQAQHHLKLFDRELLDVNIEQTKLHVNIDGFGRFMDMFFDNLISDWVVQRKIKNALHNVESVFDKIKRYQGVIEKDLQRVDQQYAMHEADIDHILENE